MILRKGLVAAISTAALILTACESSVSGPIAAPDGGGTGPTATDGSPTATTLPTETATATKTPIPEPTNTPEPTNILRPGIDTPVELGRSFTMQFDAKWIAPEFYNPKMYDKKYTIDPRVNLVFLVIEGKYTGNPLTVFGDDTVAPLISREFPFYVQGKGKKYMNGFKGVWSGYPKDAIVLLFPIKPGDQGPFTLHDEIHGWTVDLSTLPDHSVLYP